VLLCTESECVTQVLPLQLVSNEKEVYSLAICIAVAATLLNLGVVTARALPAEWIENGNLWEDRDAPVG
jgi:hypothetical protein